MKIIKRFAALICVAAIASPYFIVNAEEDGKYITSSDLSVGDYIMLGMYNEPSKVVSEGKKDIVWRIVSDKCDDDGKGNSNGKLVVSDKIIANKVFDTAGTSETGSHSRGTTRQSRGSNYWPDSNLRSWLNSNEETIEWLCGVEPAQTNDVTYKDEKGFLTNFTETEKAVIKEVNQYTHIAKVDYEAGLPEDERLKTSAVCGDTEETGNITYGDVDSGLCSGYWNTYGQWVKDKIFVMDARQQTQFYLNAKAGIFPENYTTLDSFGYVRQTYPYIKESANLYLQDSRIRVTNGTTYGSLNSADSNVTNQYGSAIRPAFYIDDNASVLYVGSGTEQDPYKPVLYEDITDVTDDETVDCELKLLNISNKTEITEDLILPTTGKFGTSITWSSSNENLISSNGKVNIPYDGVKDNYVTLIAAVTKGTVTKEKTFTFNVMGREKLTFNTDNTVNNNGNISFELTNNTNSELGELNFNYTFFDKYGKISSSGTFKYNVISGKQQVDTQIKYPQLPFDGYLEIDVTDNSNNIVAENQRWFNNSLDIEGKILQENIITSSTGTQSSDLSATVYRKEINLTEAAENAELKIFADSYYQLWINGKYVLNGPGRFDPKRPEYDTVDIKEYIKTGTNTIAVLVYGNISNGRHMRHETGLAVKIDVDDNQFLSDTTWKYSNETRYKAPKVTWGNIYDIIDASTEVGDCLSEEYDDSSWQYAVNASPELWGSFCARSIPLLEESEVNYTSSAAMGSETGTFTINLDKEVLASVMIDFEAESGTTLTIDGNTYKTRSGRQVYRTSDSFGTTNREITVTITGGNIKLYDLKLYTRVYPFDLAGSFECSDDYYNVLWEQCAYTMQQVTEDGYNDCVWERAEWMGDGQVVQYPVTRVMMNGKDGVYSDPRVIKKMIRDIALSVQPDGTVKAHHPSDRFDTHAYIEDYACIWIESLREYYDNTNDIAFVNEIMPTVKSQIEWFLSKITDNGLVNAREFIIFDNPIAYQTKEGATLNALVYKALRDASYLCEEMGDTQTAQKYYDESVKLAEQYNSLLWDVGAGNFKASTDTTEKDVPNHHSAVFSLYSDIVDNDKRETVEKWLAERSKSNQLPNLMPYTTMWVFRELYDIDTDEMDARVLEVIKDKWVNIHASNNPGFVTGESFGNKRPFHNFGAVPGYILSAYVLGVQKVGNISEKQLEIKPRLGDLTYAKGDVCTEFGVVSVSWNKNESGMNFELNIPEGISSDVYIPIADGEKIVLNGSETQYTKDGRFAMVSLEGGTYEGYTYSECSIADISNDGSTITVTTNGVLNTSAQVIIGVYSSNDELLYISVQEYNSEKNKYIYNDCKTDGAAKIKAFIFENIDKIKPVTKSFEINL